MPYTLIKAFWLLALFSNTLSSQADMALIAVAANFKSSAEQLQNAFANSHPQHQLTFSSASTGVLFNQIRHGAPFNALLAADEKSPEKLEQLNLGIKGSRFTYAQGQLVLASRKHHLSNTSELKTLLQQENTKIAIANPKLAPYGLAAQQSLVTLNLWQDLEPVLIRGNNINQTQQFVITGNASFGFIPLSPLLEQQSLHFINIPHEWHKPIRQQAILLQSGQHNEAAKDFLFFLKSETARLIIEKQGYLAPDSNRI